MVCFEAAFANVPLVENQFENTYVLPLSSKSLTALTEPLEPVAVKSSLTVAIFLSATAFWNDEPVSEI